MKRFLSTQPYNTDLGLLLLRVLIGLLMAFYGYAKLMHFNEMAASDFWAKDVNFLGFTGKVPLALTIFAEFFCSLLLLLGLLTRLSLIPLLICMAYIFGVMGQMELYNSGDNGTEINRAFVYFLIYVVLFLTGPGKYSIDYMMARK